MAMAKMLSTMMGMLGGMARKDLPSYNCLETVEGSTFIAKDGSLATVVRVDGTKQLMGIKDLENLVDLLSSRLSSVMSSPGHAIQVWFARDPDYSKQLVSDFISRPRAVARKIPLELDDLFEATCDHLPGYILHEAFYMVLWTRLDALSPRERKQALVDQKPPPWFPVALDTQYVHRGAEQLVVRHRTFASSFVENLKDLQIRSTILEGADALRAIRASVYPDMTGSMWQPHIPGAHGKNRRTGQPTYAPAREPGGGPADAAHLLWPRIDDQIFDREAEIVNQHVVRVGAYNFCSVDVTVGQMDPFPFSDMINRMSQSDEFPWRVSFLIEGDSLGTLGTRKAIAAVLQITSKGSNKRVVDAVDMLQHYARTENRPVVRMRVSFATWAPADDKRLIEQRGSRLLRTVESWGGIIGSMTAGDPLAGVMSSALAIETRSTATAGYPPLPTALAQLPLLRDSSPFSHGSVLFRTKDKRAWLFQPGSALQDNSVDLIYATPGKGKSVLMNTLNMAFCLSPTATSGQGGYMLPRVAILDIGPSSKGLISLLREALPPALRSQVIYTRLRNIRENSINPFGTQLGAREPLPNERDFLINFLTLIGTPIGASAPPQMLAELAGMLVDEAFKEISDRTRGGHPRPYIEKLEPVVDDALKKFSVVLPEEPSWWTVVDTLFLIGDPYAIRAATIAQRYAMPRLQDLMKVVRSEQVEDSFGEAITENGSKLLDIMYQMLNSALREYPILSDVTRFDLGDARVVALDLDEMAPRGGAAADKMASMSYMLGRYILARDFYLNEDLIKLDVFPPMYKEHHLARIRRIRETPKRICFDEYHRTKGTKAVRDQCVIDVREGRKWGVQVVLCSQAVEDFDDLLLSFATGVWILGVNNADDAAKARKIFGLSDEAYRIVRQDLNGPGKDGAPFLVRLMMKDGQHEHMLYNTLPPVAAWAYSTTPEDAELRNRLYASLGAPEARRRLARKFPGGSAKEEILARKEDALKSGQASGDAEDGAIASLASEIERVA